MLRLIAFVAVFALSILNSHLCQAFQDFENEPSETRISLPTRIDWTFVIGNQSLKTPPPEWIKDYQSRQQTYQLYVPDNYNPEKPAGLILFVSPTPRAMAVNQWKVVCDDLGLLLVAPNGAGNQCYTPHRAKIVLDALDDVRRKFPVDPDRTYIAGFSGGGRVACRMAFGLPEYFGGVIPIGSAGELRGETWLQDRVVERISVAFMAGSEDFNYTEIRSFRGPLLESTGVRTKTWIVEGVGHVVPAGSYLLEAVKWLEEKAPARADLASTSPNRRVTTGPPPSREEQAQALFDEAGALLKDDSTKFRGHMLLKGIAQRWPDLPVSEEAMSLLALDQSWERAEFDRRRQYLISRSRGLDGYATKERHEKYDDQKIVRLEAAILSWQMIVKDGQDAKAVEEGQQRLEVLEKLLAEAKEDQ